MIQAQAIVFPERDRVEVQDITLPEPGPRELLVRLEYSGVSQGTEIWALTGRRRELQFPTVPGYQAVGVVERTGAEAGAYRVGQRVLFHRSRLSDDWPDTWMAGHVNPAVVPIDNDPPPRVVPEGVDPVEATQAAMVAVSLRGVDMLDIGLGDLCVVLGQGLIGQAAAQLARLRGATVIATDLSPKRLELSAAYSADRVVNVGSEDLGGVVRSIKPGGADIVIDTTGRSAAWREAISLLRWEGQFLMQGFYPDPVTFDFHETHLKKPRVMITCGIGDTQMVLELMRLKRLRWREMVTHLVPVAEAPALYAKMAAGDPDVLGVVFQWA